MEQVIPVQSNQEPKVPKTSASEPKCETVASPQGTRENARKISKPLIEQAYEHEAAGNIEEALECCQKIYEHGADRLDNLLLLGALHFRLRNFSECVFYNQQAIRINPNFAEAYGNLGSALRELGDVNGAIQFFLSAIKLKPRFCDAYNNLASAYMHLGKGKQAAETYQMALVLNPNLVNAHSNLGNYYKAQGRIAEAKRCYLEAIRIQPDFAIAWSNLAGVFTAEGDIDNAIAYLEEAVRASPNFADAYSNLGNLLKDVGRLDEAKKAYRQAIKLRPDFAIAHGNLAGVYYEEGNVEKAVATYKHAIQLEPNYPDAYNNYGNALREQGQLEEAINMYRTCLKLKADHPHAYNNLGNALKDKRMIKEAVHCYVTACRLMPRFAAAHSNLASILKEQGKVDQAIAHYREAISIDPNFADAYSNMGNTFKDMGRIEDAVTCYTTAIKAKPNFPDAYSNLANTYKDCGRLDDAITCYRKALSLRPDFPDALANLVHSLVMVCDWRTREVDFRRLTSLIEEQLAQPDAALSIQPFHGLVYPLTLKQQLDVARRFAERCKVNVALLELPAFRFKGKKPNERLRIGYVSSDFGNHPLSYLCQSIFGMQNRSKYEVFCYALSSHDGSAQRKKIESEAEHFKDISTLECGDAARLIHSDKIHILVNLNGYTKGSRNEIFALKPAPIQVSFMGFCGTLGADYIQYAIVDRTVVPDSAQHYYSEKHIVMPNSYFVNDHKQSARFVLENDDRPTRESYGIPEDKFVFANFNQCYKLDPETFACWCRILKSVPNSLLWLLRFPPMVETNLRAEAKKHGIKDKQILFTDVEPREKHLLRGYLADVFLDTPVCNAYTTGCDILWSGTPILACMGNKMASRVSASLLRAADLGVLVTNSLEDYEQCAITLGNDPKRVWELRRKLESTRHTCPLFDTSLWVKNMEKGFEMVWKRHERGMAPDHVFPDVGSQSLISFATSNP